MNSPKDKWNLFLIYMLKMFIKIYNEDSKFVALNDLVRVTEIEYK